MYSYTKFGLVNDGIKQKLFTIYFRAAVELDEITYRAMMGEFIIYYSLARL